jgi:undecaprenyl diphosphate synthase
MPLTGEEQDGRIPTHIAIIMDGNGRWAQARGLSRLEGHQAGTENLRQIIKGCVERGVKYLTIYAFSTENWGRPKAEVDGLMHILELYLDKELEELCAEGVQLRHIGRLEAMPEMIRKKVEHSMAITCGNTRLVLNIAWNYGGRDEIVHAIQKITEDRIPPGEITEELVSDYLFTKDCPDPDLIIRTSGELRTSNFLLWQAAYSEWYITPTLWPDFDKQELFKAIDNYGKRERRFGKVTPPSDET